MHEFEIGDILAGVISPATSHLETRQRRRLVPGERKAALGLHPAHVQGVANTTEVVFLLDTGAAAQGLVHLTDVRADPNLSVFTPVAASAYPPIVYAAAVSTLTHSPNARAFLDYLHSPAATETLRADGVETVP